MRSLIPTLFALFAFAPASAQIMPNGNMASYEVTSLHFNTTESEFAPVLLQTGLAFCKAKGFEVWATPEEVGSSVDCQYAVMSGNEYGINVAPKKLWGALGGKEARGAFAFSPNGLQVYFTRQKAPKKGEPLTWGIYVAGWEGGSWDHPVRFDHNIAGFDVAHPAISADGRTLYFASDMEGGYGGMDLYVCQKIGNTWSRPQNLGPEVNSIYNEIYPSVHRDGTVYFASNGHNGIGGYDLFATQSFDGIEWSVPQNLGEPINSRFDDFGITLSPDKSYGYLSSNRKGAKNDADIYYFAEREEPVALFPSYEPAPMASQPQKNQAAEQVAAHVTTPQAGYVSEPATQTGTAWDASTAGNTYDYRDGFRAQPAAYTIPANTAVVKGDLLNELAGMNDVKFGDNDFKLTAGVAAELDRLADYLRTHSDLVVEVGSHTASKGEDNYNLNLSIRRAHAARAYLLSKGIAGNRVEAKGYGESQLLNRCANGINCPDAYHRQNDRMEVKLVSGVIDDMAVRFVANAGKAKDVFGVERFEMDINGEYYQLHIGPLAEIDNRTYSECKKLDKGMYVDQQPKGETIIVGPYLTASDAVKAMQFLNAQGIQKVRINDLLVKDEMRKDMLRTTPVANPATLPPPQAEKDEPAAITGKYQVFVGPFKHVDSHTYDALKRVDANINLKMTSLGMMVVLGPYESQYKAENIRHAADSQVGKKVNSEVFQVSGERMKSRKKRRLFKKLFGY